MIVNQANEDCRIAVPMHGKDTIRILIATDSHVGYMEDDPIRGDDSWQTFHEVMALAKDHDVCISCTGSTGFWYIDGSIC